MTQRYGVTIPFDGVTLPEHKEWFHMLADIGYTDVWTAEVDGTDGFTPLTLAAAWESRLNLGVAVLPAYTRGAGLLAMSIASLAHYVTRRGFWWSLHSRSRIFVNACSAAMEWH